LGGGWLGREGERATVEIGELEVATNGHEVRRRLHGDGYRYASYAPEARALSGCGRQEQSQEASCSLMGRKDDRAGHTYLGIVDNN